MVLVTKLESGFAACEASALSPVLYTVQSFTYFSSFSKRSRVSLGAHLSFLGTEQINVTLYKVTFAFLITKTSVMNRKHFYDQKHSRPCPQEAVINSSISHFLKFNSFK